MGTLVLIYPNKNYAKPKQTQTQQKEARSVFVCIFASYSVSDVRPLEEQQGSDMSKR